MSRYNLVVKLSLATVLFVGMANPSHAKTIYTGIYGLHGWGDWPDALDITRDNKFDIVVSLSSKNGLDMAHSRGLKCLVNNFGFTPDMVSDEAKWQNFLSGVRLKITALKDHPAVFGWYLVDEPDWQNVPIDKVKTMNALVKSIDSKHPIFTVLTIPNKWIAYLPHFDIVSVDPYLRKNRGTPDQVDKVRDWIRKVKRDMKVAKAVKPLWVTLGAFDQIPRLPTDTNEFVKPTPKQFNEMVDISLEEGVDGVLVWKFATKDHVKFQNWSLIKDDPELWEAVRKMPVRVKKQSFP